MRRRGWVFAVLLALGMAGPAAAKTQADALAVQLPAHPLEVITHEGSWLNMSHAPVPDDFHGRLVVLLFWRYSCPTCLAEMDRLAQFSKAYAEQLVLVAIHSPQFPGEAQNDTVLQALMRMDLHSPVLNDAQGKVAQAFKVDSWPSYVVLDPRGGMEAVFRGEGHVADITSRIEGLAKRYSGRLRHDALPVMSGKQDLPFSLLDYPGKIAYLPHYRNGPGLMIADSGHNRYVITDTDGKVLDIVGAGTAGKEDGSFEEARFWRPEGMAVDGDSVYLADAGNHLLRMANLSTRKVITLAGTGAERVGALNGMQTGLKADLASPQDVALWPDDKHVVMAMAGSHQLWSFDLSDKLVRVLAGTGKKGLKDGAVAVAELSQPSALAVLGGKLYFLDAGSGALRVLDKGQVKTLVGREAVKKDGASGKGLMQYPLGLAGEGSTLYVADSYNHAIRRYDIKQEVLDTLAGQAGQGKDNGTLAKARFSNPEGVAWGGGKLYVADTHNRTIRVVDVASKEVATINAYEETRKEAVTLQDALPNTTYTDPIRLERNVPVRLKLKLKPGWHINQDAPSYMALFDLVRNNEVVASFDRGMLKQNQMAIAARVGMQYRLQGTFYYCEDKKDAVCLVKSIDAPVGFEDGANKAYTIELN